jgi:N-acetylneuraminate synthase
MNKNSKSIKLGNKIIHPDSKPYIIAEIGVNHEGSMAQAKKLIVLAKEGGADAAKFQSYKADSLASKNSPAYWDTTKESTKSQHELFQNYDQFEPDDYTTLAEYCKTNEIEFISTPFDDQAIEYLNPLVPFFKIASADITNVPFLRKIACKGKPVVLSTGASTLKEIDIALDTLEKSGSPDVALLHCILNYPTPFEKAHLRMIKGLIKSYPENITGYSDHTLPDDSMTSMVTAHLLGAVVLEKHFTHDKTLLGNDHYHAMDVNDLKRLVGLINQIHVSLGSESEKKPIEAEKLSRLNARRSIVLAKSVTTGHKLNEEDLTYKRPGVGISPLNWNEVIGKKVNKNLKEDDVLQWDFLE